MKLPLLAVILGPTASGKTSLSLALAEQFQGEIVSCDSVAVYRELEIGTARQPLSITVRIDKEPECSPRVREAIYRIAQEALSNVVRHAQARSVSVELGNEGDLVTLEIVDDGVGFDADADQPGRLGQVSMRERATALGGTLGVTSQLRAGTTIRAVIPCEASASCDSD